MTRIEDPHPSAATPKLNGAYGAFVLVNITSSQVPAVYGTLAHTAMLNAYVKGLNPTAWPAGQTVNLNWIDHPFPINKKL